MHINNIIYFTINYKMIFLIPLLIFAILNSMTENKETFGL